MDIVDSREQALALLSAANNHADLVVKLSSLKQAKDILSSLDSSSAADLFPYLADLQRSPESLVRKFLVEIIEDIALKAIEHSSVLVPVLVSFLRDSDSNVVRQSIVSGTNFFCSVLEEMALQFQQLGKVDRWLEELWIWMVRFKEGVFSIALEPGPVGAKLRALKFLETYVLLFTPDSVESEFEATRGSRRTFNVSWLSGGHPILDPVALTSDANRTLFILLDMLQSASSLPGSVTIAVVNCLATIARKRPLHYGTVLSALLDFNPNFETVRGCHNASVQYSLRTAFLGFLRCTYPSIVESRDRLIRALRAMNAGDAADQVIRQVEKMIKNSERASRENRSGRDDQLSNQAPVSGDVPKKRSMPQDNEELTNGLEMVSKRSRYGPNSHPVLPTEINDPGQDYASVNGLSTNSHLSDGNWTPVEQMIAMIGALLAEGERGAESLEILISKIHPDLLADIVITNMKHLPKSLPPLTRLGTSVIPQQAAYVSGSAQVVPPPAATSSLHPPVSSSQLPFTSAVTTSSSLSETSIANNFAADAKRDPRRDPRRLDPRRAVVSVGVPSAPMLEDTGAPLAEFDGSISNKPLSGTVVENPPVHSISSVQSDDKKIIEGQSVLGVEQSAAKGEALDGVEVIGPILEVKTSFSHALSPPHKVDEDSAEIKVDAEVKYENDASSSFPESDQNFLASINVSSLDETGRDLPALPLYVELTEEQKRSVRKSAVQQIAESYLHVYWSDCSQTRMALLARLIAQIDADDDIVVMLGKQIVADYQQQKGHEIVLQILYHLYSLTVSNSVDNSSYSVLYEKFLLEVANSLLDTLPASDKSFSRLLGEAPSLPDSALKLLSDLCYLDVLDVTGKEIRDTERVTQGLGVVWSLILGRPNNRPACLGIALKCAVHPQEDIRGKAIRLVANKLYQLSYISGEIEQFATNMLMSAVDQHAVGAELLEPGSIDERGEREVGSEDTSISGSQLPEPRTSGIDSLITESTSHSASVISFPEAQRLISLYFALCTKKPSLLQLSFDIYGRASKTVKQAFHRHIPIVIRALGQSYSQLLRIISDPPQGSENLLTLVLQILTQDTTPSPDLIATVKHLYETKLKDATILIPMLSSLSKSEVLPIFPRLVDLPLEKFQLALAHILQGSAHTGPALTPAEVLVAIHDIVPEKDGLPLKKIMDACSACFEQRTVFTQQVLAKALNQMVDQIPLPLLFMRTVIQAIDAFPTLVDFVMEILSKLVSKQVWRMPKLWVGFLKCVAQTQPHSFPVLLQLPPPQLESALNKYGSLRSSLTAYASQPTKKGSLPRSTLAVLGLASESHMQQPHVSNLHPSDTSSVQGTTLT